MTNIFYEHYRKRDGAIYKDLASLDHNGRIKMLNEYIRNQLKMIESKPVEFKHNVYSIAYFKRLINFCNKNKNIQKI